MSVRGGQLRPFVARLARAVFKNERSYHLHVNVCGPGSKRGGRIIPSSFAVTLPESLARGLYEALGKALDKADEHDDHDRAEITTLPGEDDV